MEKLQQYWKELQRRHVVKAGIAYLAIAWIITEVATAVLPLFEVSEVLLKGLVILLAVGFPIWLIIAWVYDFTPEGIKKTEDVPFDPKVSAKKNLQLNRLIIGGLSIAVILLIVNQVRLTTAVEQQPAMASMMPDFTSSIAVLAFDDMSPDKDQEYLSDGISEEILNYLAKYEDLKVISRTSSFAYKGKDVTIDVIGEELGVAYVLEGSVRKAGDTYRITVQLIDTKDGAHIWSDTFDREIEDVLFVQDEIAEVVAGRLNLTLSNEDVRLRKVDPEAYDLYLQALDVLKVYSDSATVIGDSLLRHSINIDPDYAPTWAYLSGTTLHKGIYNHHLDRDEAIAIGVDAANKAIELDSTNIIGLNWLSNWQWHARQGNASFKTLEKLMDQNPNNGFVLAYAKHAYIRMGMPEKALGYAYRAAQVSPNLRESYKYIADLEAYFGNYPKALIAHEKFLELLKKQTGWEPSLDDIIYSYELSGNMEKALEMKAKEPNRYWRHYGQAYYNYRLSRYGEGDKHLDELLRAPSSEIHQSTEDDGMTTHFSNLAHLYATKGDMDKAFNALDLAFENYVVYTEELWMIEDYKNLHQDPRWDKFLDRLGKEFNFDYNVEG